MKKIDITPSWQGILWIHLAVIANKKAGIVARAGSVHEIERLVEAVAKHEGVDAWNLEQLNVIEKLGAKFDADRKRVTDELFEIAKRADEMNAASKGGK